MLYNTKNAEKLKGLNMHSFRKGGRVVCEDAGGFAVGRLGAGKVYTQIYQAFARLD